MTTCLLCEKHRTGKHKARFFAALGFSPDHPEELLATLLALGRSDDVVDQVLTPYSTKYVVDGSVDGPEGAPIVRTIWFLERKAVAPRLVTAYPAPHGGRMTEEHDLVVLTRDIPEHGLETDDVGAVVAVHEGGGYEVEFVSAGGETLAVPTLEDRDLPPMRGPEIMHVRSLASP